MKKVFLITLLFTLFFSLTINAWISVNPSSSIAPTSTIEGNLFTFPLPNLTINSPANATYLYNHSLSLNYSVFLADSVWYSLDSGDNITSVLGLGLNNSLTNQTFFANSTGSHTLYIYANNTAGLTMKSVNFSVDTALLRIIHTNWSGTTRGSSTNFTIRSFQDIQNLSNLTFEHTSYGKIHFNEKINLTKDEDTTDNQVNLDEQVNISFNRIELNSTALPNFDKPATLWLYSLTFTNPRILIDGEACPSAICKEEDYSGGTLRFNVTGFVNTIYSADETPTGTGETIVIVSGGTTSTGGGSSGIMKTKPDFDVNIDTLHIPLTQGSIETASFIITNNLDIKVNISLEEKKLSDFLILKEKSFVLNPRESKEIFFDIVARENAVPNLYAGRLMIKGKSSEKEVLVLVEVESKGALLDMKLEILPEYLQVSPGEDILTNLILYNLGAEEGKDITLEYIIKDENGNDIILNTESVAIETQMNIVKRIPIPEDMKTGKYILYVKSTYDGKTASASALFRVEEFKLKREIVYLFSIVTLIILLVLSVIYYTRKRAAPEGIIKKVNVYDIISKKR